MMNYIVRNRGDFVSYEKRGSTNFVKQRKAYVHDQEKLDKIRKVIEYYAQNYERYL